MSTDTLLLVGALAGALIVVILLWRLLFTPKQSKPGKLSAKRIKHLDDQINVQKNQAKLRRRVAIASLFRHVPFIGFSDTKKAALNELIASVDERDEDTGRLLLAEEVYLHQVVYAGIVILVAAILSIVVSPWALLAVLAVPFIMQHAISGLAEKRDKIAREFNAEFFAFYKMYHVQFARQDTTATLLTVVETFIAHAGDSSRKVLSLFATDLTKGEEYALVRMDERYPQNQHIHKFCALAKARIRGDRNAISQMNAFLEELQEEQEYFYTQESSRRTERIKKLTATYLSVAFVVSIAITIYLMLQ